AWSASWKRRRSTSSATWEKRVKFVPHPSHVAPSGYGVPGQIRIRPLWRPVGSRSASGRLYRVSVGPEGRTIPDRDQRVGVPRFSRGSSGVLPRFTRPIYAALRLVDPVWVNRSSMTSATSAQAPSAGETAAAPAARAVWRIRSAKKPGASREGGDTERGGPARRRAG